MHPNIVPDLPNMSIRIGRKTEVQGEEVEGLRVQLQRTVSATAVLLLEPTHLPVTNLFLGPRPPRIPNLDTPLNQAGRGLG